ncbi:MAG: bifunctional glycosyltransferase family 2 protein/CDP-glycerol:glycerophosphate glycerophosphotransferase [Vagococcus sp.]|uniref:bifunctional glycosyltransferase/CDP-glycerol:glycerophosphate glycerophosphotransferase n=1 Tax=Vagococcus sp. TaxID=1933889 RepID=UPI002FC9FB9F
MDKIRISAVIAIYNVEEYIVEALDSLLEQEVENIDLEVIVVDDGSTDQTPAILKEYQKENENIKVINVDRVGLGKARNVGIETSTGEYLIFMDGDDIIYPNAYYAMLESALKNDADIVVGNVSRFDSTRKFFLSGLHKKIFSDNLEGTHILKNKQLIYDTTAWNKLFKASFFKENNLKFLEGMLYEDIPCIMKAHLLSKKTNIILDYVYRWRLRDSATNRSITQNRHDTQNLLDRVKSVDCFTDVVNELNIDNQEFLEEKEFKELTVDYKLYFDMLLDVDLEYFNLFSDLLKKYIDNMKTDVFEARIPVNIRLMYQLVLDKKYDDLVLFKNNILEFNDLKTSQKGSDVYKDLTETSFSNIFDNPIINMSSDIIPITKTKKVRWAKGILSVEGFVYLQYLNTDENVKIQAFLVNRDESEVIKLPTEVIKDKSTTQLYGGGKNDHLIKRHVNYDYSYYKTQVDVNNPELYQLLSEDCFIKLVINNGDYEAETYVTNPSKGALSRPTDYTYEERGYRVLYNKQWRLEIISAPVTVKNLKPFIRNEELVLSGIMLGEFTGAFFKYSTDNIKIPNHTFNRFDDGKFELIFNIENMLDAEYDSDFYLYLIKNDEPMIVWLDQDFISTYDVWNEKEIRFTRTYHKWLKINLNEHVRPKLVDFKISEISDDKYQIQFTTSQLISSKEKIKKVFVLGTRKSDGKHIKIFPKNNKLENHNYDSLYEIDFDNNLLNLFGNSEWSFKQTCETEGALYTNNLLLDMDPLNTRFSIDKNNFRIFSDRDGLINLSSTLEKTYFEKGPRRAKLLTDYVYPLMRLLPQKKKYVMFESYWGKSFSCNPKAIYEEIQTQYPELECVWSFNNPYTEVTGNAKRVKRNSWQYYYYLARSTYFFNNANWQNNYVKRRKSVEVQTLHGTFLKTMGLDVTDEVDTQQKLDNFRLRHSRWDYLVSPSKFMTDISKRVFEFNGEMLEYGFPRNDILVNANQEKEKIEILKNKLGIPKDKKVILYAPTFRNTGGFNLELDLEKMKEQLSDEYVLLVRLHYFVSKNLDLEGVSDFVINVCDYPDAQELLLITDVLISDYSSIMFDYANLNKPIILFTYDLEYYRDILRGMYTDLEKGAPGKLCRTTQEVVDSLTNLDGYEQRYKEQLSDFREKFNEFESGKAAKSVVEKIF